jgi:hypothetical protein
VARVASRTGSKRLVRQGSAFLQPGLELGDPPQSGSLALGCLSLALGCLSLALGCLSLALYGSLLACEPGAGSIGAIGGAKSARDAVRKEIGT